MLRQHRRELLIEDESERRGENEHEEQCPVLDEGDHRYQRHEPDQDDQGLFADGGGTDRHNDGHAEQHGAGEHFARSGPGRPFGQIGQERPVAVRRYVRSRAVDEQPLSDAWSRRQNGRNQHRDHRSKRRPLHPTHRSAHHPQEQSEPDERALQALPGDWRDPPSGR